MTKKILIILITILILFGCNKKEEGNSEFSYLEQNTEYYQEINNLWDENKEINPDYKGQISFYSGLIDLPFVQATNEKYLRRNWETMEYSIEGSIFMEEDCNTNSQNITIYGHNVFSSYDETQTHMFTPLLKLMEENNYEINKYIELDLENESRTYLITNVYIATLYEVDGEYYCSEDLKYYSPKFSEKEFETYYNNIKSLELYNTKEVIKYEDELLTLQTCIENHPEQRLIIVSKLVKTDSRR